MTASIQQLPKPSQPRASNDDAPKVRAALANGKTVGWCSATHGWPRDRIRRLIDTTPGWLYDSDSDTIRVFDRSDDDETGSDNGAPAGNLEDLLRRGAKSDSARTRNLAAKVRTSVEDLRRRLVAEDAEKQIRARIAGLKQQLAAAEEQLRSTKPGKTQPAKKAKTTGTDLPEGVTAKDVRRWAKDNRVKCPAQGRIPGAVIDRFRAAHGLTSD